MVVHGADGLDEITTTGQTQVAELDEGGQVTSYTVEPEQFGLAHLLDHWSDLLDPLQPFLPAP
ncbi:hypothetical protein WCLP8_1800006 [uncultured Gammaproteobacteria bacterium]